MDLLAQRIQEGHGSSKSRSTCLPLLRNLALLPYDTRPQLLPVLVLLLTSCKTGHDEKKVVRLVHFFLRQLTARSAVDRGVLQRLMSALAGEAQDLYVPRRICALLTMQTFARGMGEYGTLYQLLFESVPQLNRLIYDPLVFKKRKKEAARLRDTGPALHLCMQDCPAEPSWYITQTAAAMCSQDTDTARAAARNMAVRAVRLSPSQAADALRRVIPEPPGAPAREPPSTKKGAAPVQPCVNTADVGTCVYFVRACGALFGVTHASLQAVAARVGAGTERAVPGAAAADDVVPVGLSQLMYTTAASYVWSTEPRVALQAIRTLCAGSMDWMVVATTHRDAQGGAKVTLGGDGGPGGRSLVLWVADKLKALLRDAVAGPNQPLLSAVCRGITTFGKALVRWEAQGGGPVPDAAVASLSDLGDRLRSAVGSQPSQFLRRQMLVALVWAVQALPTTRTVTKAAIHEYLAHVCTEPLLGPGPYVTAVLSALSERVSLAPWLLSVLLSLPGVWAQANPALVDTGAVLELWKDCSRRFGQPGRRRVLHSVYTVVDGRPVDPSPLSWFHYHRLRTSALWFLGENANFLSGEYRDEGMGAVEPATPAPAPAPAPDSGGLNLLGFGAAPAAAPTPSVGLLGVLGAGPGGTAPSTSTGDTKASGFVADGEGVGALPNAVLRSIVLRLLNGATLGAYEVRQVCLRALITIAIRCHDPSRFAVYTALSTLVRDGSGKGAPAAAAADAHSARKERGRLWPLVSDGEPRLATKQSEVDVTPALRLLDDVYACKAAVAAGATPPHTRESLLHRAQLFCHLPPSFGFE